MDTNRASIIGSTLPVIAAAFAISLSVAAVAAPAADSDGKLYAAVPTLPQHSPSKAETKVPTRFQPDVMAVRDVQAERAISGSEPDPETFDKVGLETWWKKHSKVSK